jgi:hypothetical protein
MITRIVMVSAGGVVLFIFGSILFLVGLIMLIGSTQLPALYAGQYLIFSSLIMVGGIVLCVLGYRTGRNKKERPVPSVNCKNCGTGNPITSEFCGKCGIKNA